MKKFIVTRLKVNVFHLFHLLPLVSMDWQQGIRHSACLPMSSLGEIIGKGNLRSFVVHENVRFQFEISLKHLLVGELSWNRSAFFLCSESAVGQEIHTSWLLLTVQGLYGMLGKKEIWRNELGWTVLQAWGWKAWRLCGKPPEVVGFSKLPWALGVPISSQSVGCKNCSTWKLPQLQPRQLLIFR